MSVTVHVLCICHFVFFNDTATTEIYTLSLHDASSDLVLTQFVSGTIDAKTTGFAIYLLGAFISGFSVCILNTVVDRKSTRLNSSHANISYAVFCLKKKNFAICRVHV